MADSARGRFRDALRERDFRRLVTSYLVDETSSWAYSVVLAVYVFDRTGSVGWVAAVSSSRWVTGLIVGRLAGGGGGP